MLRDHPQPYDLGECEFHLAMQAEDYDAAHARHKAMGCICYENQEMGIYFISDPDGIGLKSSQPGRPRSTSFPRTHCKRGLHTGRRYGKLAAIMGACESP